MKVLTFVPLQQPTFRPNPLHPAIPSPEPSLREGVMESEDVAEGVSRREGEGRGYLNLREWVGVKVAWGRGASWLERVDRGISTGNTLN